MMRIVFICIIITSIFCEASAQQKIQYDSSVIHAREFSKNSLSSYKTNREFQYDSIHEPPKSLWDKFIAWIDSIISRIFSSIGSGGIVGWILTILAAAIIVFVLIKISGMGDGGLFGKKSGKALSYTVNYEDIHSINFDGAIQQAIDDKNFRLAVRLLYLQTLKILTDKGKINWQINKTNFHYLHELSDTSHQPEFMQLTKAFENNWYGNIPVPESGFNSLRQSFANFNQQL